MDMDDETQSIKPKFNPQAILDYYNSTDGTGGTRKDLKHLVMKAKQHLLAVGWSVHYLIRKCGKREPRYSPPNANKKYLSVRTACKAYLDNERQLEELSSHDGKKLCSVDECDEGMLRLVQGREDVEEKDDGYVPCFSLSMQHEKREFWIDLFQESEDNNVVNDLKFSSVDDTGRKEGKLDEGVKRRKIGGKDMNVLCDHLKKGRVKDLCLSEGSEGKDCESGKRADEREIGGKGGIVTRSSEEDRNDDVCSICMEGGDLVLCDQCPAAFHAHCLGLSGVPASEYWYCQSCCCGICGRSICRDGSDMHNKQCDQCEKYYHVKCIGEYYAVEVEWEKWFCSKKCESIFFGLDRLLGNPIVVDGNNLTWTLLKNNINVNDHRTNSKLKRAVAVMHECFKPVKEPWGGRDVGEAVIFSRKSDLKQLDYRGFYTVILQRGNRIVAFATVRVLGYKVAEVPFIGTRYKYRRQGMCKTLMNVLEEKLISLGVEKVVLPAMPSVLDTWTSPSFAFTEMTASDRSMLMGYTFLEFPGTIACQKLL